MLKSQIRILVVDDDADMALAMSEFIKRMGMQAVVCRLPDEALGQFKIQGCDLIIADCLLPKMSGVDFVKRIRAEGGTQTPVIFFSGIYKDKSFIRDTISQTKAVAFLSKPLDFAVLQGHIEEALKDKIDEEVQPLERLISEQLSPGEKLKVISETKTLNGLDLPWMICSLLAPSNHLQILLKGLSGKTTGSIDISGGKITKVETNSPRLFFGALLIEKGLVSSDKISEILKTQGTERIGQILVNQNLLSPHIIDVINVEQMALRLSMLVSNEDYQMEILAIAPKNEPVSIDSSKVCALTADWVSSKIDDRWLRPKYLKWLDKPIQIDKSNELFKGIFMIQPVVGVPKIIKDLESGITLENLLTKFSHCEDLVYKVVHILAICGFLKFKMESRDADEASQIERLNRVYSQLKGQDHFIVLGITRNALDGEIKRSYYELAKIFHPDKLPPDASPKWQELAQKVFGLITTAHGVLSDSNQRTSYLKSLEMGNAEKHLQAEAFIESGRSFLKVGQPKKAKEKIEEAFKLRPANSDMILLLNWAKLSILESQANPSYEEMKKIREDLDHVPPEDRHDALYYFVRGLHFKMDGDRSTALKMANQALAIDPKFSEAERLFRILSRQTEKKEKTNILQADIKDVVGMLFNKKKK